MNILANLQIKIEKNNSLLKKKINLKTKKIKKNQKNRRIPTNLKVKFHSLELMMLVLKEIK